MPTARKPSAQAVDSLDDQPLGYRVNILHRAPLLPRNLFPHARPLRLVESSLREPSHHLQTGPARPHRLVGIPHPARSSPGNHRRRLAVLKTADQEGPLLQSSSGSRKPQVGKGTTSVVPLCCRIVLALAAEVRPDLTELTHRQPQSSSGSLGTRLSFKK